MSPRPGRISAIHTLDLGPDRSEAIKETPEFYRWLTLLRRELK
jgi:NitT/TauT family transport system ATP-binding protein